MPVTPQVGTNVRVKAGSADSDYYKSRVADIDAKYLYIDIPVNPRTGRELEVRMDAELRLEYAASGSEVYRYTSPMLGIAYIPTPAVRLNAPEKATDLERIQRREFFRISLDTPVLIRSEADGSTEIRTQSIDISGGGLAVSAKQTLGLTVNEVILASLVLPYTNYKLEVPCRIVRIDTDESEETVLSMAFIDIKEREREQVVRYTFMRQRAMKR